MSDVTTLPTKRSAKPPQPPQDPPAAEPAVPFVAAHPSCFRTSADFEAPTLWFCAPANTPFDHLKRPEYWASLTPRMLRRGCHMYAETADGKWWAHLYVDAVGQGWAKVLVFAFKDLVAMRGDAPADPSTLPKGYTVEYRGPIDKYRVMRLSDNHVMQSGIQTEEAAYEWVKNYQKVISN